MSLITTATRAGIVRGIEDDGTVVFQGIPYAQPPVGELRFAPPQPELPWQGERPCATPGPAAFQYSRRTPPAHAAPREYPAEPVASEDCLYLNVWTPAETATEKLPVMLWIHGGAFTMGYGADPAFDGAALSRRGVVVITINYRLGALGFLAHPLLSADSGYGGSGNYGLMDQIAALEWVRDNAAAFGGDPDNVTVFGQSAGGISAKLLLVSPAAQGLLHRAIVQSGGALNAADLTRPVEELGEITEAALDRLGWSFDDLRRRDAEEVNTALSDAAAEITNHAELFVYQPCIDGRVLVENPEVSIAAGRYDETIDVICGTVRGDWWMFSRKVQPLFDGDVRAMQAFAVTPGVSWGRANARATRRPIRSYLFERAIPGTDGRTPHGAEIGYVFGTLDRIGSGWDDRDYELSAQLGAYWANFARTGDPNGSGLPEWPPFAEPDESVLHLDDTTTVAENVVTSAGAEALVEYTIAHPGMLEHLDDETIKAVRR